MINAQFPQADEGELARRLQAAGPAGDLRGGGPGYWALDKAMIIGDSEAQTGGRNKKALLGDVCESVLGSALSRWRAGTRRAPVIERHWRERMVSPWGGSLRDAKTDIAGMGAGQRPATPQATA